MIDRSVLKWIAVLTMVIDHVGAILFPDQIWMRDPVLQCREELIYYGEVFEFIRCGKTPASTGGEYNKLVSVAGVNPPSDKRSA